MSRPRLTELLRIPTPLPLAASSLSKLRGEGSKEKAGIRPGSDSSRPSSGSGIGTWGSESEKESEALSRIVEELSRPRPLWPLLLVCTLGFYSGIITAAVREQKYKEGYWVEHPGEAVPVMRSRLYQGPQRMRREDLGE